MAIIKKASNGKYFVFKDERRRDLGDNLFSLKETLTLKIKVPKELRGRRVMLFVEPYNVGGLE